MRTACKTQCHTQEHILHDSIRVFPEAAKPAPLEKAVWWFPRTGSGSRNWLQQDKGLFFRWSKGNKSTFQWYLHDTIKVIKKTQTVPKLFLKLQTEHLGLVNFNVSVSTELILNIHLNLHLATCKLYLNKPIFKKTTVYSKNKSYTDIANPYLLNKCLTQCIHLFPTMNSIIFTENELSYA